MSDLEFRQLGAAEVSTRVARALEMSSLNWAMPPWTDDFRRLRALIAARLEVMPPPRPEPEPEPVPDELRAALEEASGPVLLVDDRIESGWTMTVAAKLLREAGAPAVLPLALAVTTG
jgi:hypothetical protein